MNNHINFTSAYNPHMEALSSAQKFDPVKLNEMFSQVMGNIASVQALTTGNTINVRDFAPGDGSNQSVQIKAFFDSANEGDVLLFTPGHYKVVKSGWFYTFTGRSVIIRALPGAIFEDSNHIEVSGLTLIRTTQAGWSKGRTGIHVENSSNVICKIMILANLLMELELMVQVVKIVHPETWLSETINFII